MKSDTLNRFYRLSPNSRLFFAVWVLFWTFIGYCIGVYFFNHVNFEKAYQILGEYINRDIKVLEKSKDKMIKKFDNE